MVGEGPRTARAGLCYFGVMDFLFEISVYLADGKNTK
jgi:hypothetical protein